MITTRQTCSLIRDSSSGVNVGPVMLHFPRVMAPRRRRITSPRARVQLGRSMAPMPIGSGNELKSPFATVWPWVTVNPLRGSVLIFNGTPSGSASAAA